MNFFDFFRRKPLKVPAMLPVVYETPEPRITDFRGVTLSVITGLVDPRMPPGTGASHGGFQVRFLGFPPGEHKVTFEVVPENCVVIPDSTSGEYRYWLTGKGKLTALVTLPTGEVLRSQTVILNPYFAEYTDNKHA